MSQLREGNNKNWIIKQIFRIFKFGVLSLKPQPLRFRHADSRLSWLQILLIPILYNQYPIPRSSSMSCVNIVNVQVLNNPSTFTSPLAFKVMFECLQPLPHDLEWKLMYVGSAKDESKDQILDCLEMEIPTAGVMQFTIEASGPKPQLIPFDELLKLTAIILTISYKSQEFFRLGYYVHYECPEEIEELEFKDLDLNLIKRYILADKPRITKTPIDWKELQIKPDQKDSTENLSVSSSNTNK